MDAGNVRAAGLLLRRSTRPSSDVLLIRAAPGQPSGTWGLPGGDWEAKETVIEAALRAAAELTSVDPARVRVEAAWVNEHEGRSYTTVLATADGGLEPGADVRWAAPDDLAGWPLDPPFAARWAQLRDVGPAPVLIVDGANVVGSRPDGWWRDRAGAAARLRDRLAAAGARGIALAALQPTGPTGPAGLLSHPEIILVTEGAARPVPSVPGVQVVPAPGSGDDQIVRLAAERSGGDRPVVAVTADRELRRRLAEHDVPALGPGTALRLLTPAPG